MKNPAFFTILVITTLTLAWAAEPVAWEVTNLTTWADAHYGITNGGDGRWDGDGTYYNLHSNAQTDPKGASSGSNRVLRGGSWGFQTQYMRYLRSAYRNDGAPSFQSSYIGFRIARNG
jgi:formylglycine-generating enzyme required for sulfatase activity